MTYNLHSYFSNKYKDDEKIDLEYCDELCYYPNTKEYLDFINDLRTLLNDRKINMTGWRNRTSYRSEFREICNIFNTPEDKNNKECHDNNIFWVLHALWESILYAGNECLPQQLLNDFKKILDNNNDISRGQALWLKYKEIKQGEYSEIYYHKINFKNGKEKKKLIEENKTLIEENKTLIEENIQLVEKEDVRKKVQQWLENNSREINFKNGKELYDIIN